MTTDKRTGYLTAVGLVLVIASAIFYSKDGWTYEHASDVPPVPALEEEKGCGFSYTCWKEKLDVYRASDEVHKSEDDQLRAALDTALGKVLYHDEQAEAIKKAADKTVLYLDGIISEQGLALEAERLHTESLASVIQAWEAKSESMTYVQGCWIPVNTGQEVEAAP